MEHDDEQVARARVGRAIRDIGHAVVGHQAGVEDLHEIAAVIEGLVAGLLDAPERHRETSTFGRSWDHEPTDGDEIVSYADRPVSGAASPWGVDMTVRRRGHEAVAEVTLRSAHEGAPDRSHGGVVAAIFDDLMGFVLQIERHTAFTGEITVRYEAPVPLHVPLVFRAWLREQVGRKLHIDGTCHDGTTLVARSSSTFIRVETYA